MEDSSYKSLVFDEDARGKLASGVNLLANAVKVTMGPRGQNVVIERPGHVPHVTKDGVTVARAINLRERFANLGTQMVKEAASRTADVAGDGTTTATVLAQAIFIEGMKILAGGYMASDVIKGIESATHVVIDELKVMARPVTKNEDIIQVGTISANGDKVIGDLLLSAMLAVGRDGIITVENAKGFKTSLDVVEGCEISRGFLSPYFLTSQEKLLCAFENPVILLANKKLSTMKELVPLLQKVHEAKRNLLIIADDVEGDALHGLVLNKVKGTLNVCAIRAPEFGETRVHAINDLGVLLGCQPITAANNEDLINISLSDMGSCKRVIIYKNRTVFVGCHGDKTKTEDRIHQIKELLDDPTLENSEIESIHRRIARLSGGVAVLRVGGATELELQERKDRVDDALNATQAAVDEGVLPGGGVALVKASRCLQRRFKKTSTRDFYAGVEIIKKTCEAPLRQIVVNAGELPELILRRVEKSKNGLGYDAMTCRHVDMFEEGIIDPLKVVKSALENASSTARMLLSVSCAIVADNEVLYNQQDDKNILLS